VNKDTVLLAEQVGLFLAPMFKELVESAAKNIASGVDAKVAEAQEGSAATVAKFQEEVAALKKRVDDETAQLGATFAAAVDSLRATFEKEHASLVSSQASLVEAQKEILSAFSKTSDRVSSVEDEVKMVTRAFSEKVDEASAEHRGAISALVGALDKAVGDTKASIDRLTRDTSASADSVEKTFVAQLAEATVSFSSSCKALGSDIAGVQADYARLSTICQDLASKTTKIESANAGSAERLDQMDVSLRTLQTNLDGVAAGLSSSAQQLREALEKDTVRIEVEYADLVKGVSGANERVHFLGRELGASLDLLSKSVEELRQAHFEIAESVPKLVEGAVSAIKVPAPDMDAIHTAITSMVGAEFEAMEPAWKRVVAANVREETAKAVSALPKPKDGTDGVLPVMEPWVDGVVYERGAAVLHAGGAWQATQRTKTPPGGDLSGWRPIAVGVSGVDLSLAGDSRAVTLSVELSSGSVVSKTVAVPTLIYRRVYDDETQYDAGDAVTFKGSIWVANAKTKGAAPKEGEDTVWRLAVKAGRDGKGLKGKDGIDGVQFSAGFADEYVENKAYPPNSIVTYNSSVWLSKRHTKERPPYLTNQDNSHWLRLR
jgi:hypothetical protein